MERPEGDQGGIVREPAFDGGGRSRGDQDLAAVRPGADAGHLMYGEIDVIVPDRRGLTRVQSDPHSQHDSGWPSVRRKRSLTFQTGSDRLRGVGEGEEERVTLGADLDAATVDEGTTKQPLVGGQQFHIPLAELAEQTGRAFDVGHDEGDDPSGER